MQSLFMNCSCLVQNDLDGGIIHLIHYIVKIIGNSVMMYFIVFDLLFNRCLSIIDHCVESYFKTFQTIFLACLETPQIYFMFGIVFMILFTFYLVFRTLWLRE